MSSPVCRPRLFAPAHGAARASPVLHAELLGRVRELNHDYLELLSARAHVDGVQHRFPTKTLAAIRDLSAQARGRLAAAPYTLFRLRLGRGCVWSDASHDLLPSQRYAMSTCPHAGFCDAAVLHAWHVASTERVALRLTYGLDDDVAGRLAAAPLWRLKRIAHDHPEVLEPRWPTNRAFWPLLTALAAAGDEPRLRNALLLGHSLIAAELARGR